MNTIDLSALKPVLSRYAPDGKSQLLPALIEAQQIYGYLSEPVVAVIAQMLEVPEVEAHGVIEFYTMLYPQPVGRTLIRICTSPICAQTGGKEILGSVCAYLGVQPGGTTEDGAYTVEEVECLGLCDRAPAALVDEVAVTLDPESPPGTWIENPQPVSLGMIGGEPRWLSGRCGVIEPTDVGAYETHGGYSGLHRVLTELTPAQVVDEIKASGLVGRGGAAFPTGLKWQFTAGAQAEPHYVVCNADESEPGTFKDRVLMEGDPLSILEGMAIAAYAIQAHRGYLYVRGEYFRAQEILLRAIENACKAGYLGQDILGSGFDFEVELRSGAGAYICGEETSLFESIEGRRGFPRLKPPFPTTHGLFGKPTSINNVETLCAATWIMAHGSTAYRALGTEDSPGTKLFCLSGDVKTPGVYEVPYGTPMSELIRSAGGVDGKPQAFLLGGAAGAFASPDQIDIPMSFETLREQGLPLGSGVVVVINDQRDLRPILYSLAHFFAHESCGKCFPCQLGTQRQMEIMEKVVRGEATTADIHALHDVIFAMTEASLCGLGKTAGTAILSALEKWPAIFSTD